MSEIIGTDKEVMHGLYVVLCVVCCKEEVDITKFEAYCDRLQDLILEKYTWHPTSSSVHKLLNHAAAVMRTLHMPLGYMTEECLEVKIHFRTF